MEDHCHGTEVGDLERDGKLDLVGKKMNKRRGLLTVSTSIYLTAACGFLSAQTRSGDLLFEPNVGQSPPETKFLARLDSGTSEILTSCGLKFGGGAGRLTLVGGKPSRQPLGRDKRAGKLNYFRGNDATQWRTNISTYKSVICRDVYAGVDLRFYGDRRQLEFDFDLAPGADPRAIRMRFGGCAILHLDSDGDLIVGDQVLLRRPVAFQETGGSRVEIHTAYDLDTKGELGFRLAAYDKTRPLVIDPIVVFTHGEGEVIQALAVDTAGNTYVAGEADGSHAGSASTTPALGNLTGSCAAYVRKLNSAGSVVYTTFIGGSGCDSATGIAVDGSGNAYIAGYTSSIDFPTTANALQPTLPGQPLYGGRSAGDAFMAKLDPSGSALIYSTYLGGNGYDRANAIAVDSSGNALVSGYTSSTNFPTANAAQATSGVATCPLSDKYLCADGFVTKLDPTGSELIYSTYLGGNAFDNAFAIGVDATGNALVTGWTRSPDFPTLQAVQPATGGGECAGMLCSDAFVSKLSPSGELLYSTYLGGGGDDHGTAIAADRDGNVFVAGGAGSGDFPTVNPLQSALAACPQLSAWNCADAFVAKLDAWGKLVYSTYLGGWGFDGATSLVVNDAGEAIVAGFTIAPDFPTLNPLHSGKITFEEGFVAKLNRSGSGLLFSTYLGNCGLDCQTWGPSNLVIAERHGDLYVGEALYDTSVIWGPLATMSVVAKIHLDDALPRRYRPVALR
jgi:hypothetical protein